MFGPIPRPCRHCAAGGKSRRSFDLMLGELAAQMFGYCECPIRNAVRAETGRDVVCATCGAEPGPGVILLTDHQDHWWCEAHHPALA